MRKVGIAALGIAALLVLAAMPDVLTARDGAVVVDPGAVFADIGGYLTGLATGEAFTYRERWYEREFLPRVVDRAGRSYLYLAASGLAAVTIGSALGLWTTARRMHGLRQAVTSLAAMPDFVLALLLQLAVVAVYRWTGVRIARVASITTSDAAVLLPILVLTAVPMISVLRTVSSRAHLAVTEDHALAAKAQGLSRRRIYLTRVTPLALASLLADLPRLAGAMIANLFIVEYLFNVRGVTTFVFARGLSGGYQYDLVANSLLLTIGVYGALYALLRTYVRLLQHGIARL